MPQSARHLPDPARAFWNAPRALRNSPRRPRRPRHPPGSPAARDPRLILTRIGPRPGVVLCTVKNPNKDARLCS
eukprot:6303476-Pyramimonas_sp.AAC.1